MGQNPGQVGTESSACVNSAGSTRPVLLEGMGGDDGKVRVCVSVSACLSCPSI